MNAFWNRWNPPMPDNSLILPPEREVNCECDVRMHRPVYRDPTGVNHRVSACLRCGLVTVTESLVEEPHPNDVQCVGNRVDYVDGAVLDWLAQWPRLAWGVCSLDRNIYLPAALRCGDLAALQAAESRELGLQHSLTLRERLDHAGYPAAPAPAGLPSALSAFAQTWQGLQVTEQTPLDLLIEMADRANRGSEFAIEVLNRRPHIAEEIAALILSDNPVKFRAGLSLASHRNPVEAVVMEAMIARMRASYRQEQTLQSLLTVLSGLGPAASAARPALQEIAAKIGHRNYYLHKRVEQVRDLVRPKER